MKNNFSENGFKSYISKACGRWFDLTDCDDCRCAQDVKKKSKS